MSMIMYHVTAQDLLRIIAAALSAAAYDHMYLET